MREKEERRTIYNLNALELLNKFELTTEKIRLLIGGVTHKIPIVGHLAFTSARAPFSG